MERKAADMQGDGRLGDRLGTACDWAASMRRAQEDLAALTRARDESETRLRRANQTDALKAVTGTSAIDNAIAATQRMIQMLQRELSTLKKTLTESELRLLTEMVGSSIAI